MWGLLVFAYGACIGSLINVIVYRLPLGLSIVTPPSRCPKCQTKLAWKDNIPVLGWIMLRGKCRYCGNRISAEYPIVEAIVGLLFVAVLAYFYLIPSVSYGHGAFAGFDWAREWYRNEPSQTWPTFVVLLVLLSCLVAMTIIDARTFTIPPMLTTVPVVLALIVHPIHAAIVGPLSHRAGHTPSQPGWMWAIATPDRYRWDWIVASIGGTLGLALAIGLVRLKLLPQSFADYAEWEESVRKNRGAAATPTVPPSGEQPTEPDTTSGEPGSVQQITAVSPPIESSGNVASQAAVASPAAPDPAPLPMADAGEDPSELWIQYPHARREVIKELIFLAPCLGLAMAGWHLARWHWGIAYNPAIDMVVPAAGSHVAPLWLTVLSGVLWGYLIGGGIVWAVRILGSLAFGKEAMGLGDVHLMAAVGACLGWIDSGLAFMGAAFVGLFWFLLATAFSGAFRRTMPYGPYLAVSTLLVILGKPIIEVGLSRLAHTAMPVPLPP
jgi:prepilin signal peptidase PulO-like enzyme (type II secretory pathway)